MQKDRDNAKDVSRIALWDNLINYYKQAYTIALNQVSVRLKDLPCQYERIGILYRKTAHGK